MAMMDGTARRLDFDGADRMDGVLMLIGVAVSLAGLVLIGFGIPALSSSTGSTMMIAGAITGLGGLILIALAAILQRLSRLAHALEAWPLPRSVSAGAPSMSSSPAPAIPSPRLEPEMGDTAGQRTAANAATASDAFISAGARQTAHGPLRTETPADDGGGRIDNDDSSAIGSDMKGTVAADDKQTAGILKSGVIEGMAYTLYVDGSIEAELPQGTVRFKTLDELRDHLARRGSV